MWGGWHLMYAHIYPIHARTSLYVHRHMPPYVHKCLYWGFLAHPAPPPPEKLPRSLRSLNTTADLPREQSDIQSNNVGCGAHLEAPRPIHGGICMHIWAQSCRPKQRACGSTHGHMWGHPPTRDTRTGWPQHCLPKHLQERLRRHLT